MTEQIAENCSTDSLRPHSAQQSLGDIENDPLLSYTFNSSALWIFFPQNIEWKHFYIQLLFD